VEALAWDDEQHLWRGEITLADESCIEVVVVPKGVDSTLALSYATFAFSLIVPKIDEARDFAARKLVKYYNYYNAHLQDGEQLTVEQFSQRLRLERIRFRGEGRASLDFAHTLYRGDNLYAGGLIVVDVTREGSFKKPAWVTEPDAEELRRRRHFT